MLDNDQLGMELVIGGRDVLRDPGSYLYTPLLLLLFALIVRGDSMLEAGILDGDMVVVSPSTPVGPGEIGVVQVNRRTTTLKRIYVEEKGVLLQPANSSYKPEMVTYPDEVEILGKVILGKAEELGVPVMVAPQDTLSAATIVEQAFTEVQFHEDKKIKRYERLLESHLNYEELRKDLGLVPAGNS